MTAVSLTLISHTNVGKTTLARTLLRRDVGEIRDASHITIESTRHTLLETSDGDVLELWDTPGFGDSVRLLRRLEQSSNPLGWFLSQVWDRFADRAFFSSQQAIRTVRDDADVVLYLVNAAEDPVASAYVEPEMRILAWIGKPVIVLLNQLGPPDRVREARDLEGWRDRLASLSLVRSVMAFDAFARCWVQEHTLLDAIAPVLPAESTESFARLHAAWRARNEQIFEQSMHVLVRQLVETALDVEPVNEVQAGQTVRGIWARLTRGADAPEGPARQAMSRLGERLGLRVRSSTDELIALHGLSGRATTEVLERLRADYSVDLALDPAKAGLIGGVLTGAVGGLAADIAAGGMTLGAGAVIGALLGAAGSREIARAYNTSRGIEGGVVRWSPEFLQGRLAAAVLRYLAVAHYGRGRGDYVASESPPRWRDIVVRAIASRARDPAELWSGLTGTGPARAAEGAQAVGDRRTEAAAPAPGEATVRLQRVVIAITRAVLAELYPEAIPSASSPADA